MSIRIVPHSKEFSAGVEAFIRRMRAGGSSHGFYVDPEPDWIPKRPGQNVWREFYVAIDEQNEVHGGFCLKPQDWIIRGETKVVTDWQGPVSEGSVNPQYAPLAMRLIREMVKMRPAIYSWGHGGNEQPMLQLLLKMNWFTHATPFCLRVLRPFRFFRLNRYLRTSKLRRIALNLMAFSGVGVVGVRVLHAFLRLRAMRRFPATAVEFKEFGSWADDLWKRCQSRYTAIAVRDAASMNLLAPATGWPPVTRLRIERAGEPIGWALVMASRMRGDARFGDLYVGSIVDCFADPADAGDVVSAATTFLRRLAVDIIVSNQSHPGWVEGFGVNGFLLLPGRRLFVASPELKRLLEPISEITSGLHLTNMDGHGPHAL